MYSRKGSHWPMTSHLPNRFWSFLALLMIPALGRATTPFTIEPVAPAPSLRGNSALALDASGSPHVAYMNASAGCLAYATKSGGGWTDECVDAVGYASFVSLVLDSGDTPHILYNAPGVNDAILKYATKSGGQWLIETLDQAGTNHSIALTSSGEPRAAWFQPYFPGNGLRYASRISGAWVIENAPTDIATLPFNLSLQLDSQDRPYISYVEIYGAANRLTLAKKLGVTWSREVVLDAELTFHGQTSLALDSHDIPRISYVHSTTPSILRLGFAELKPSGWVTTMVDATSPQVGTESVLVLDSTGEPRIRYFDVTNRAIKYAYRSAGSWTLGQVALTGTFPLGDEGRGGLALDSDDNPFITYYDAMTATINLATTAPPADTTPPTIVCPTNASVLTDPGMCTARFVFQPTASDNAGEVSVTCQPTSGDAFPLGSSTVQCVATDGAGNMATCSFTVTVQNPPPGVNITSPTSGAVFAVDTPVTFTGTFTDNAGDVHTAEWTFDSVPAPGSPTIDETAGTVTLAHTFSTAGVYKVTLTVRDQCGGAATAHQVGEFEALVVVYDPDAGFVTGGGWISSMPGAYMADPALSGKANFGFVSRYERGASIPTGQTEFQFKVANLNFHSSTYEWLVVAGERAQYKGTGAINAGGDYGFLLTAIDGEEHGGPDKFRMKIWDRATEALVYDNQLGTDDGAPPTTALGGGAIVIHRDGAPAKPVVGEALVVPGQYALRANFPDPFNPATTIEFDLPEQAAVSLKVYDIRGKLVAILADRRTYEPGRHRVQFDATGLGSGVYFYTLQSARYMATQRMVLLK